MIFGGIGLLIAILTSIFWIWMLIDCLLSRRPTGEKILWVIVIALFHIIGALIYFFVARHGSVRV